MTPYSGFNPITDDDPETPACPYCLSLLPLSTLLRYEQDSNGANVAVYKCNGCDTIVKLPVDEIPF